MPELVASPNEISKTVITIVVLATPLAYTDNVP